MKTTIKHNGIETIQLNSLADLDQIVSERFNLPPRRYSTDIRAALELIDDDQDICKLTQTCIEIMMG